MSARFKKLLRRVPENEIRIGLLDSSTLFDIEQPCLAHYSVVNVVRFPEQDASIM